MRSDPFDSSVRLLLIAGLILTTALAKAQEGAQYNRQDSLATASDPQAPDSLRARPRKSSSEIDAPIDYSAQIIDNFVADRVTILLNNAVVKYKTATLKAGKITVDWNKNLLIAEPLPDSLRSQNGQDSISTASDLDQEIGLPTFSDGGDQMTGERMEYNFATEKGRVVRGRTEFDGGNYFGQHIKRINDKVLNVSHGIYTTCDNNDNPHYHFASRKMKIIVQDKVIARPIVFYIGKIPLAILPFAIFPMRTGRHSGLIIPRYGQSTLEGRYLKDLGYYWAINDYLDARATVDFYDRSGWFARAGMNYAKRYSFTGRISGSITRKNFALTDRRDRFWDIAISHSQTFGQNSSLNVSGNFISNNSFYRELSDNRDQQLRRRLRSNATYSRRLADGRGSFSINVSDEKDLEDGSFQRTLPQISLSLSQRQLFGSGRSRGARGAKVEERAWYHNLYYSLTSRGSYRISRGAGELAETETRATANHRLNLSLNSPKRYFGWLNWNQSMSVTEDWFDRATDYFLVGASGLEAPLAPVTAGPPVARSYDLSARGRRPDPASLAPAGTLSPPYEIGSRQVRGFAARHTFSYSTSANTTIYGTFPINKWSIHAVRHRMSPSVSFSFRPDFSDPSWGYYEEIRLPDGSTETRDRFGGTPRGKQASINFSLGNLFQMKAGSEENPKKIDLFTLNFNSGYNFAAETFKHSNLTSRLQANPSHNISVSMSTSHSFYDFNDSTGITEPRLLWRKNGILSGRYLRLTNFTVGANIRLQGTGAGAGEPVVEDELVREETPFPSEPRDRFAPVERFTDTSVPWRASLGLSYNLNRSNPLHPTKRAQLNLTNAEIQLTKNWRVSVSGQFDLITKSVVYQTYTIHRDLHCWEMQVRWTPSGFRQGFYLRINIKAPHLRDIKLEKRGGRASIFGGGY